MKVIIIGGVVVIIRFSIVTINATATNSIGIRNSSSNPYSFSFHCS